MKKRKQPTKEQKRFAVQVVMLKHRAGELGLFKTMHALEPATQAIGWELAEMARLGEIT